MGITCCFITCKMAADNNELPHMPEVLYKPNRRQQELSVVSLAVSSNPNYMSAHTLPPGPLPDRLRDPSVFNNKKLFKTQHPMYSTSANTIGSKEPSTADIQPRWYGRNHDFTRNFLYSGLRCQRNTGTLAANSEFYWPKTFTGLNTTLTHSRFHHQFDQGWRGDAHTQFSYLKTAEASGSNNRIY